jgi:hypothetical protein
MVQQTGMRPAGSNLGHFLLQGSHAFRHPTRGVFLDFVQHD